LEADAPLGSGIGVQRILSFHWPDFDEPELHKEWVKLL
jgi:hypothetical protein